MTSLIERFQTILELKDPREEARKKFISTWMELNGELVFVRDIIFAGTESTIVFSKEKSEVGATIRENNISSLSPFMPESGVYPVTGGAVVLTRLPRRQWLKSYNDSIFQVKPIGKTKTPPKIRTELFLNKEKRCNIWVEKNKNIYYWDMYIGKIQDKMVLCFDGNFKQELKDFLRQNANT